MPVTFPTWLDFLVLGIMLVSGLLAMIRGFMREILSIAGWLAAAVSAYYLTPKFLPSARDYLHSETLALVAVAAGVFLATLIVATVVTSRLSDFILDSRIGALDRTLGFLFGLARGLLIVVVAFVFFSWLVPDKQQPDGIRNAKSLSVLQGSGKWLQELPLMDELLTAISKKMNKGRPDDEQTDAAPELRSSTTASVPDGGYGKPDRDSLRRLIEGRAASGR